MIDETLIDSARRVNDKYLDSSLDLSQYRLGWQKLTGSYGRVSHRFNNAKIILHEKLKGDDELTDYVMLHELLHTVKGFRGTRRHRGKFNSKISELQGKTEFKRLEARLKCIDIRKRVFKKRYVYECPECKKQITRKKQVRASSCAICDKKYNPRYKLALKKVYRIN